MLNHKTITTILTITALCLISLARAEEKKPWEPELGKLDYDIYVPIEKERELYQMDIKQITPKDGIRTGYVIAYGHFIKPPYKFEIVNDTMLFLNGVQIEPQLYPKKLYRYIDSIRAERAAKDPYQAKKDSICRAITTLDSIARVIYKQVYKSRGRDGAVDTVMKFFKAQDIIDSVSFCGFWDKDGAQFEIFHPRPPGKTSLIITLRGPDFKPDTVPLFKSTPQSKREVIERFLLKKYNDELEKGWLLLFTGTPGSPYERSQGDKYIRKLLSILDNRDLSLEEKFSEVEKIKYDLPLYKGIKVLLYNYTPSEWPKLNEIRGGEK